MTEHPTRSERWMLATLAVIQFTATLDFMVMMPLAPQFTRIFGLSAQQFGFLISAYTFAAAGAGVVTSVFIERLDRKRLLLPIYSGFVASAVVTASAQSYPMLLGARALAGIFGGELGGVVFTIIGHAVPESRRGRATGIVMTSFSIATVAGVPAALLLGNWFGWRAAFVLVALLGTGCAVAARRTLPDVAHAGRHRQHNAWADFLRTLTFPNHLRVPVHSAADGVGLHGDSLRQPVPDLERRTGRARPARDPYASGRPFLGLCLGTQIILDYSEEDDIPCLGIMPGSTRRFPRGLQDRDRHILKIPHMGWIRVSVDGWSHPIMAGIEPESEFYFVHSFYPDPRNPDIVKGSTDYGITFPSLLCHGNLAAVQFHPEKSGCPGLRFLENFCRWRP